MVNGVAAVWVPVRDMDRALAFYGEILGLPVRKRDDGWAELDGNGLVIGLNAHEEQGAGVEGGPVITFEPGSGIEGEKRRLQEAGVEFPADISEHPWGRIATFKDSEGNNLQLYAPPR